MYYKNVKQNNTMTYQAFASIRQFCHDLLTVSLISVTDGVEDQGLKNKGNTTVRPA